MKPLHLTAICLLALSSLTACESARQWTPAWIHPYRPDIPQGNVVTREMIEQLRPGMSREEVRFLLGTPLVKSMFRPQRWDYVYYLKRGKGTEVQLRRVTVFFKDDRLDHFVADELPAETQADNLILGREAKDAP
ncbi:MAG TPA: outer membrane protein assembly factor BamE [Burkholderiaceae bacterium]|nr:outer membrane protein assembly factor BamE [Burkholderiaceae bacterium]